MGFDTIEINMIWLLKVYMPSNETEAVLFLTKNEKAYPNMGVNYQGGILSGSATAPLTEIFRN